MANWYLIHFTSSSIPVWTAWARKCVVQHNNCQAKNIRACISVTLLCIWLLGYYFSFCSAGKRSKKILLTGPKYWFIFFRPKSQYRLHHKQSRNCKYTAGIKSVSSETMNIFALFGCHSFTPFFVVVVFNLVSLYGYS